MSRDKNLRFQIAETAAKLMNDSGYRDFQAAKQKAAQQLGISERRHWPSNQEIEQALIDYQRLFEADVQPQRLRILRLLAINAMRFLQRFDPRLVGSVLQGAVTRHAQIQLHLFCDFPETIGVFLEDNHIPFNHADKRIHISGDEYETIPVLRFAADGEDIELFLFHADGLRQSPLSPVDGKPMRRAMLSEVETLAEE